MYPSPLPDEIKVFERGWLSANNILFTGPDQNTMVDSGYCTHSAQTLDLVESQLQDQPLDFLINTHLHSDHCGGNAALQQRYRNLEILVPPGHAQQVSDWDAEALTYLPTGQQCPQFHYNQILQPGTEIKLGKSNWEVHAASGHDPHSLILFEPINKILISADALWENGFGVVFPELDGVKAFEEVSDTFNLIESLRPAIVIPGHGPVFNYSSDILTRARSRLEYFIQNPSKHALHGVKVLIKFKLLEVQQIPLVDLMQWAVDTPYFTQIRNRFFGDSELYPWIELLLEDLITAKAAKRSGSYILNA